MNSKKWWWLIRIGWTLVAVLAVIGVATWYVVIRFFWLVIR